MSMCRENSGSDFLGYRLRICCKMLLNILAKWLKIGYARQLHVLWLVERHACAVLYILNAIHFPHCYYINDKLVSPILHSFDKYCVQCTTGPLPSKTKILSLCFYGLPTSNMSIRDFVLVYEE